MVFLTPPLHALNTSALVPARGAPVGGAGNHYDAASYAGDAWTLTFKETTVTAVGYARTIVVTMQGGSRDGRQRDLSLAVDTALAPLFVNDGWTVRTRNKWYVTCTDPDRNSCEWVFIKEIAPGVRPPDVATWIPYGSTKALLDAAFESPDKLVEKYNSVEIGGRTFSWWQPGGAIVQEGRMVEWRLGSPAQAAREAGWLATGVRNLRRMVNL